MIKGKKILRKALVWMLTLLMLWTGTALAQDTFTNGYFTYQIPVGMEPIKMTSREQTFISEDATIYSYLNVLGVINRIGGTIDDQKQLFEQIYGELTALDEIKVNAEGVESWAGVVKYLSDVSKYVLIASVNEQIFSVDMDFDCFDETTSEKAYDIFCSFAKSISVNESAVWSELAVDQQDRYENGYYYLAAAKAYVEIDDQTNVVLVHNPPADKETLAKQLGITAEMMREELNLRDADMLILPVMSHPEAMISISVVENAVWEGLTSDDIDKLISDIGLEAGFEIFYSDNQPYYCMQVEASGMYVCVYQTVVEGAEFSIGIVSENPLTDEIIAYAESIIDHISFESP